jgi:hypothetical protein
MTASNPMAQKRNFIIDPDKFSLIVTIGSQRQKRQKPALCHNAMLDVGLAGAFEDSTLHIDSI